MDNDGCRPRSQKLDCVQLNLWIYSRNLLQKVGIFIFSRAQQEGKLMADTFIAWNLQRPMELSLEGWKRHESINWLV